MDYSQMSVVEIHARMAELEDLMCEEPGPDTDLDALDTEYDELAFELDKREDV